MLFALVPLVKHLVLSNKCVFFNSFFKSLFSFVGYESVETKDDSWSGTRQEGLLCLPLLLPLFPCDNHTVL